MYIKGTVNLMGQIWWLVFIVICADEDIYDEPFYPFFALTIICQFHIIKMIHMPPLESFEENHYYQMEDTVME